MLVFGWVAVMEGWWFGLCGPRRPGHTPLAALRLLAPLSPCERGGLVVVGDVGAGDLFRPGAGMSVFFEVWQVGTRRVDFLVEGRVVVELSEPGIFWDLRMG